MTTALNITDVGPIEKLGIALHAQGGVTVLRGSNGSGKTTALNAADALVRGKGKLATRDDAKTSGRVEGFGAMLLLGSKVTRAGEAEVSSLEGKLNIADLVEPPLKDPAAADRARIKALVSLTGVEPSPELFAGVMGKDVLEHINAATWANKDLLEVASKAKRDLEGAARLKENESSMREGQAKACEESAAGVDVSGECNETQLRAEHVAASGKLSVLQDRQEAARNSAERIRLARERLTTTRECYTGPTVEQATSDVDSAIAHRRAAEERVKAAEERLRLEKAALSEAQQSEKAADLAYIAAKEHAETIQSYEAILNETATKAPTDEELQAAQQAVDAASTAIEQGALIRRAKSELEVAAVHRDEANEATATAERLRAAASQVDDVLSQAVATDSLFVRDGRLWSAAHKRGEVLFHELSEGERWTIAFDIAAPIVGEGGILVLPQGAWESLDPTNRAHVAELARAHQVNVLTAEATDGELRAESFGAN